MSAKYNMCPISGKRIIRNKRLAEKRMDFINKISERDQVKAIYKCPHCSGFHLTKMSQTEHVKHIRKLIRSSNEKGTIIEIIEKRINFLKTKNRLK